MHPQNSTTKFNHKIQPQNLTTKFDHKIIPQNMMHPHHNRYPRYRTVFSLCYSEYQIVCQVLFQAKITSSKMSRNSCPHEQGCSLRADAFGALALSIHQKQDEDEEEKTSREEKVGARISTIECCNIFITTIFKLPFSPQCCTKFSL